MGKIHEVLAIEQNLKSQTEKTRADLIATFQNKRHLFAEKMVTFLPAEEGAAPQTEEQLDLNTTVRDELKWVSKFFQKSLDASYQVCEANMSARADVTLDDGTVLLAGVPATALMELTKRVGEMQQLLAAVPTLDPAKGFRPDPERGDHIYRARDDRKTRTRKTQRAIVLYPATEQHPAQTQLISEDVPTGTIQMQEWSGLVTPAEKAEMLERVEDLQRAGKRALSRANEAEVNGMATIGEVLTRHVFWG